MLDRLVRTAFLSTVAIVLCAMPAQAAEIGTGADDSERTVSILPSIGARFAVDHSDLVLRTGEFGEDLDFINDTSYFLAGWNVSSREKSSDWGVCGSAGIFLGSTDPSRASSIYSSEYGWYAGIGSQWRRIQLEIRYYRGYLDATIPLGSQETRLSVIDTAAHRNVIALRTGFTGLGTFRISGEPASDKVTLERPTSWVSATGHDSIWVSDSQRPEWHFAVIVELGLGELVDHKREKDE